MKSFLLIALFGVSALAAQNPVTKTIQSGAYERKYMLYVPNNVHAAKPYGLIVAIHGYNSSMGVFFNDYKIQPVADSLNYLILAPQALEEKDQSVVNKVKDVKTLTGKDIPLDAVWGCGLQVEAFFTIIPIIDILNEELNKNVDDVAFLETIIRKTLDDYQMTDDNVFLLGTSMGGYMSYQYAMYQPVKLAGIVDIVGSMGLKIKGKNNALATPLCNIHSVDDEVVPYSGMYYVDSSLGKIAVFLAEHTDSVVQFWVKANGAGAPDTVFYPAANGKSAQKITFPHATNEVIHYKLTGARHSDFLRRSAGDCIDYVEEIAAFISAHSDKSLSNQPVATAVEALRLYPNPAQDYVHLNLSEATVNVYTLSGRLALSAEVSNGIIDVSSLSSGVYLVKSSVRSGRGVKIYVNKLIIK